MKLIKIITLSSILASSLFAINTVSNLGANAPHNSVASTNDTSIVFTWNPPASDAKYYWLLDTNSSNTYADSYSTASWQTKNLTGDEPTAGTITHSLPTVSTSGTYYYHVVAVDGNDTTSNTVTSSAMNIDITGGTVTMNPDGGSLSAVASLTMTGSETGTIYYTTDGTDPDYNSTSVTGTTAIYSSALSVITAKTVKARLKDTAGNKGDVVTKAFTSTIQPTVKTTQDGNTTDGATFATNSLAGATPNTTITVSEGNTTGGFTRYKYKKSTDNDYVTVSSIGTAIDISSLNTGSYIYYILGGDAYNYKSESDKKSVAFNVDNDAPTSLTVSYDSNSTITKVNPALSTQTGLVTLSATGSSEIKYIYTSEPGTYSGYTNTYSAGFTLNVDSVTDNTEGTVRLYLAAKDASGNWAKTSKTFTVDKKKPTITMPDAKTFANSFTTTMSFDDDGNTSTTDSGSIKYLVETVSSTTCSTSKTVSNLSSTYSSSATITPQGSSNLCLYAAALDEVGNTSSISSTLFTYSSTAIQLDVDLLDDQTFATVSTHGAIAVTDINATLSSTGTSKFGYEFDSNGTETNSTALSELINLTSLTEGDHNITIKGYKTDLTDANVTVIRNFTIDNTPPTAFTSSDYNDSNFTTLTYSLTLTKPSGADYMMYSEDNTTFTTSSESSVVVTLSSTKTVYTKTKDTAGNMSATYSATFTQDIPVQSFSLTAGWNMRVMPTGTIATAALTSPTVWDYNGSAWGNNISTDSYTDITATSPSKGYWVSVSSSATVTFDGSDVSTSTISGASTGWSFLGTTSAIAASALSDANLTWVYDSGIWKYNTTDTSINTTLNSLGYAPIVTIPAHSGYWIYKN